MQRNRPPPHRPAAGARAAQRASVAAPPQAASVAAPTAERASAVALEPPCSPADFIVHRPRDFLLRTLKSFRANQGLLLAGAVAYYALLSIVPLLILLLIVLSHWIDPAELLGTLARYLEWLLPGQSQAVVGELARFLQHREVLGWLLLGTLLFFSSLAFTVLENAMSVIFLHRVAIRRRHFLVSALLPYCYIVTLGIGFLLVTLVSGSLQAMGEQGIELFGRHWSLGRLSGVLLYLLGFAGEVFILTSLYIIMPVGRLSLRHALFGGVTAALLWELTRHALVWYFARMSQVSVVYGSLATAIVVLLSLEIGATLLLLGAQVIAEVERIARGAGEPPPMHTGAAAPKRTGFSLRRMVAAARGAATGRLGHRATRGDAAAAKAATATRRRPS